MESVYQACRPSSRPSRLDGVAQAVAVRRRTLRQCLQIQSFLRLDTLLAGARHTYQQNSMP